jgi:hypothetical protein
MHRCAARWRVCSTRWDLLLNPTERLAIFSMPALRISLTECRVLMERALAEHGGQGDRREMELHGALAV